MSRVLGKSSRRRQGKAKGGRAARHHEPRGEAPDPEPRGHRPWSELEAEERRRRLEFEADRAMAYKAGPPGGFA